MCFGQESAAYLGPQHTTNLPIVSLKGGVVCVMEREPEGALLGANFIAFKTEAVTFWCISESAADILSQR